MNKILLKANQSRFTKWEIFALVMLVAGLFYLCAGCKSTQTITNNPDGTSVTNTVNAFDAQKAVNAITVAVPGAVRLSVARYPQARPYLLDAVTVIRGLTSGSKLDPASLHAAIATTRIRELQSDDVQAAIDTVAALYKAYYGDVVAQKLNQVDNLVPILNAIADGIETGLAQPSAKAETLPPLAEMAKQRDGTNYIGCYMGMIAEWDGSTSVYQPETDKNGQPVYCGTGKMVPNMKRQGVMMFSATSGELLKWISYEEFDSIFVRKVRPEYVNN